MKLRSLKKKLEGASNNLCVYLEDEHAIDPSGQGGWLRLVDVRDVRIEEVCDLDGNYIRDVLVIVLYPGQYAVVDIKRMDEGELVQLRKPENLRLMVDIGE